MVNSFLYMKNKIFLHNKAVSLWILSLSVPFRKGGQHSGKAGRKMEGTKKERKHSVAMLPSLSVLTSSREMPIRNKIAHILQFAASSAFQVVTMSTFLIRGLRI